MGVDEYEQIGREKFSTLCQNQNITWSENPNQFDYWDGSIEYHGQKYLVEIKNRNEKIIYDTIMMEQDKYIHLMESCSTMSASGAYYVSFFADDAYIYKVEKDIDIKPVWIKANKYTFKGVDKISKLVFFLPKNKVKKININDGKAKNNS